MEKQKSKYRFNIIDVLLIVLILGVLGGIYYFVSGDGGAFLKGAIKDTHDVRYVIELKTVDKDYVDNILIGDNVTETIRSGNIGRIVDVEVSPAWAITTNVETGEMLKSYYPPINAPTDDESEDVDNTDSDTESIEKTVTDDGDDELIYDYYNVRITVESEMQYTGTSYAIDGYDVVVGNLIYFRIPHYVGSGYCISLEVVE
jgi:hypothetical protein